MWKSRVQCLLVDNGSVREHAVLFTRQLAKKLQSLVGMPVVATSIAHSDSIPADRLNGEKAPIFSSLLDQISDNSELEKLYVLPLMMAEGAIIQKMREIVSGFQRMHPKIDVRVANTLVSRSDPQSIGVPSILASLAIRQVEIQKLVSPEIWVVDHGSPFRIAAETRNWVARRVKEILKEAGLEFTVGAASMERRDGSEYDFNEPLLDAALRQSADRGVNDIILLKMMLQPGKHGGKRGDIEQIANRVTHDYKDLRIHLPVQVFSQKNLIPLLRFRLSELNCF